MNFSDGFDLVFSLLLIFTMLYIYYTQYDYISKVKRTYYSHDPDISNLKIIWDHSLVEICVTSLVFIVSCKLLINSLYAIGIFPIGT